MTAVISQFGSLIRVSHDCFYKAVLTYTHLTGKQPSQKDVYEFWALFNCDQVVYVHSNQWLPSVLPLFSLNQAYTNPLETLTDNGFFISYSQKLPGIGTLMVGSDPFGNIMAFRGHSDSSEPQIAAVA